MFAEVFLLVGLVVFGVVCLLGGVKGKSKFREVRGWLPFFGHSHIIGATARFPDVVEKWCEEYGVCEFRLFSQKVLLLADPEEVLGLSKHRPRKVQRFPSAMRGVESIFPSVFSSELPSWSAQRRLMTPAFSHATLATFLPTLHAISQRMVKVCAAGGGAVDALNLASRYATDVVGLLSFGKDFHLLDDDDDDKSPKKKRNKAEDHGVLFGEAFRIIGDRAFGGGGVANKLWKLPLIGDSLDGGARIRRELKKKVMDVINDTNRQGTTILDKMIEANAKEDDRQKLDDLHFVGNVVGLYLAGTETSATTLTWMLYAIAKDKCLQAELRLEAKKALGGGANGASSSSSSSSSLSSLGDTLASLPRLRSLLTETLRLRGPSPFLMLGNNAPIQVRGQTLEPYEYGIIAPQRWIHKLPENGGPHFDPRRWLTDGLDYRKPPEAVIPFGFGARVCPGRDLAELEVCLGAAHLLDAFQAIDLVSPTALEEEPKLAFSFTEKPDRPIRVAFRR